MAQMTTDHNLSDCIGGIAKARFVLRGMGIGCGVLYRLNNEEADMVATACIEAAEGFERQDLREVSRGVVHSFFEWRAALDSEPVTVDKAKVILEDTIGAAHAAMSGYDRAWRRLEENVLADQGVDEVAEARDEVRNAKIDFDAAVHRRSVAMWDYVYLTDPERVWQRLDEGDAGALAVVKRFENHAYAGAVGAACGELHDPRFKVNF